MLGLGEVQDFLKFISFIVPGVVALYVRSKMIGGRRPSYAENGVGYVVLSLIWYGLAAPALPYALETNGSWASRIPLWLTMTIVGPALFGFAIGYFTQRGFGAWLAAKLNVTFVHVIPAAWDWRFSTLPRGGLFLMVTLTGGERVAGFFGRRSFASSDGDERDLYIEEEYDVAEDGQWSVRPARVGILIPAKEIRYVEFWEST